MLRISGCCGKNLYVNLLSTVRCKLVSLDFPIKFGFRRLLEWITSLIELHTAITQTTIILGMEHNCRITWTVITLLFFSLYIFIICQKLLELPILNVKPYTVHFLFVLKLNKLNLTCNQFLSIRIWRCKQWSVKFYTSKLYTLKYGIAVTAWPKNVWAALNIEFV